MWRIDGSSSAPSFSFFSSPPAAPPPSPPFRFVAVSEDGGGGGGRRRRGRSGKGIAGDCQCDGEGADGFSEEPGDSLEGEEVVEGGGQGGVCDVAAGERGERDVGRDGHDFGGG